MITKTHHHFPKNMLPVIIISLGTFMACGILSPQAITAQPKQSNPAGVPIVGTEKTQLPADSTIVPTEESNIVPLQSPWKNNWLAFGVDNQFSSFAPNETTINTENVNGLIRIWGTGCDKDVFSVYGGTPAIYHGNIFVTYAGGRLEAGNRFTGEMFWHFGDNAAGWAPPPVISEDGVVYYLYVTEDASSKLYAINSETGEKIWEASTQFKTGFSFKSQVTVDEENNLVYVIEDTFGDGRLFAVDRKSGEVAWFLGDKLENDADATFVGDIVPLKGGKLFVPAAIQVEHYKREGLVRVDTASQKIDMQYELPLMNDSAKYIGYYGLCNDYAYTSFIEGSRLDPAKQLMAYKIDHQEVVWEKDISGQTGRLACNLKENLIYIPTEKALLALDAKTGEIIWEHKSLKPVYSPTIANGIIYYISDTNMYALNLKDGKQLFRYPLGIEGEPSAGVAVNDGLVIFSGNGGDCDLHVLGLK
jgi:outer membrane protein assembly factor BamB